jgi:hypothetical protein
MSVIEDKAQKVARKLEPVDPGFAFDPAMILVIAQVVMEVIKAIQACKKPPAELPAMAKRPGVLGRWHVRRAIQKEMKDKELRGMVGPRMVNAVLDVGSETTEEEAKAMFAEADAEGGRP